MPTVHKAKLGEENSFVYDPELKKWVNKKAGGSDATPSAPTPPPPRGPPSRSASASSLASGPPRPTSSAGPPRSSSRPPTAGSRSATPDITALTQLDLPSEGGMKPPPFGSRPPSTVPLSASAPPGGPPAGPPSRPATSMSNASDIDDLLGSAGPRKGGTVKKGKRGTRYVDVMNTK